jgi:hypothetical protein
MQLEQLLHFYGGSLHPFPGTQHLDGVITHTLNQPSM